MNICRPTFFSSTMKRRRFGSGMADSIWRTAAAAACPVEAFRLAPPRRDGYPLARVAPGRAVLLRDADGTRVEAPLGAAGGHFGAPGVRRFR